MSPRLREALCGVVWFALVACQPQVSTPAPQELGTSTPRAELLAQEPPEASRGATLNAWCRVNGVAGDRVACPITIDATPTDRPATGLQFRALWTPSELMLIGIESTVCAPGGTPCAAVMAPPAKAVGGLGHSLATNPPELKTADGAATLMLYHASDPNAALDGDLGSLVFEVRRPVAGAEVRLEGLTATAADAGPLALRVRGQKLELGP
jgi:hypothetical protein